MLFLCLFPLAGQLQLIDCEDRRLTISSHLEPIWTGDIRKSDLTNQSAKDTSAHCCRPLVVLALPIDNLWYTNQHEEIFGAVQTLSPSQVPCRPIDLAGWCAAPLLMRCLVEYPTKFHYKKDLHANLFTPPIIIRGPQSRRQLSRRRFAWLLPDRSSGREERQSILTTRTKTMTEIQKAPVKNLCYNMLSLSLSRVRVRPSCSTTNNRWQKRDARERACVWYAYVQVYLCSTPRQR